MAATKSFTPKKKKLSLKTMFGIAISGLALLGLISAAILANMSQDNRQQAAGTGQSKFCEAAGGTCVKSSCGNGFVETEGKCPNRKRPVCCTRPSASLVPQPSSSVSPYPYPSSSASPYPSSTPAPTRPPSPVPSWPPTFASPTPPSTPRPLRPWSSPQPRPIGSPEPQPSGGYYLD